MFRFLGRVSTRGAWGVIVSWLAVIAVAASAALLGFGHGGLFQRMETSEYSIPGSESALVTEYTGESSGSGSTSMLIISGVDTNDAAVKEFANNNRKLLETENVESVIDAFSIAQLRAEAEEEAEAQIKEEIESQIASALVDVEAQIKAGADQAKAQIQAQVDAAAAMGPEAQAMAQAQADQALAQVDTETQATLEQASTEVTAQVTEAVEAAADEAANSPEALEQKEEADKQEAALISENKDSFAVIVTHDEVEEGTASKEARTAFLDALDEYRTALQQEFPGAEVREMSTEAIGAAVNEQVQSDLFKGESLGLPVAALLMLIVFGGAIAAGLPLVGAVSAIAVGMGVLWVSTWVTTIDAFILNVVSIIGLSLSIDYGLLVVSRFREEGYSRLEATPAELIPSDRKAYRRRIVVPAVRKTVASAGRTVFFSAITIAMALGGIFLIKIHMLRTIAWGGILIALLAVLAAMTLIPALLTIFGDKLLKPSPLTKVPGLGQLMRAVGDSSSDHGIFSKIARWVQKRPWSVMIAVLIILVAMASPVRDLQMRNNLTDNIPATSDAGIVYDTIQNDFPDLATPAIQAVADAPQDSETVDSFVTKIESLRDVEGVTVEDLPDHDGMTLINVQIAAEDQSGVEVTNLVKEIRSLVTDDAQIWVGGSAANQLDFSNAVFSDAPWALLFVAIAVMILLFLMTGSVIVPLKAIIINSLSIVASLGITVAIFENGWLGVPASPGLQTFIVVCMIAFGFGLSMDYEVFLLARIKEFWDAGESNDHAVALGLQRSGRIITSAAAIVIAVFIGFAMGDMLAIKHIGVGLAVMVAVDATMTRMLLVPATMTVLGKWNWWAPKPLAKLYKKVGLHH